MDRIKVKSFDKLHVLCISRFSLKMIFFELPTLFLFWLKYRFLKKTENHMRWSADYLKKVSLFSKFATLMNTAVNLNAWHWIFSNRTGSDCVHFVHPKLLTHLILFLSKMLLKPPKLERLTNQHSLSKFEKNVNTKWRLWILSIFSHPSAFR